jgi:WD40 repeat protein
MGICSTEKKKLRKVNHCPSYSNPNFNKNEFITTLNDINIQSSTSNKVINNNVYKISRKKKNHKRFNNYDFFNVKTIKNIKKIKHSNTNNSTNSKSKCTTVTSDQYMSSQNSFAQNNRYYMNSELQTIEEQQSQSSLSLPYLDNNNRLNLNNQVIKPINYMTENSFKIKRENQSNGKVQSKILQESNNKNNNKEKASLDDNTNYFNDNINNSITILNKTYFKCIKTINNGHKDKVVCLTEIIGGKIATGSYDNTIKIWNLNSSNNICERTINEEGNVFCLLEFENNMLLSGTNKNNINLFNLNVKSNNKIFSFQGHSLWVNNIIKLNNIYFASCSNDNQIRIWDYNHKICSNILRSHVDGVLSLILLSDGQLCSGGADLSIKIWDWKRGICTSTLLGHKKWIKCLCQLSNKYILSGSDDKIIKVWWDNKCIKNLAGHFKSVRTICQINSSFFASGSFDKTIKIWDILKLNCVQTIYAHKDLILNIIRKSTGEIISCSNDTEIKIWKQVIN